MKGEVARIYLSFCAAAIVVAAVWGARAKPRLVIATAAYFRWLAQPWKLVTFAVALAAMLVMAPLSGDPTWDYVTGGVQSILTFISAPWAVGTLYRSLRRVVPFRAVEVYSALVAWGLSVSWFYEAYLTWRDGHHPTIWLENLFASSGLYVLAGALWSLGPAKPGRGVLGANVAWHAVDWPDVGERPSRGVYVIAGLVILFTIVLMAPFALTAYEQLSR